MKAVTAVELAALVKSSREDAGITQAEAARAMGTTRGAVWKAEAMPEASVFELRRKMLERYGQMTVIQSTVYRIEKLKP